MAEVGEISPELWAAYNILTDDGYPPEEAAKVLVKAEQMWRAGTLNKSPEEFARHMVKLRKAIR